MASPGFLSLEDETGIANAIVEPELFDAYREVLVTARYLYDRGTISVKLQRAERLEFANVGVASHDFR